MIPLLLLAGCASGPDYGSFSAVIRIQKENLSRDPCNEQAITELASLLEQAGHIADAVEPVRTFATHCTPSPAFEEVQLAFAKKAGQWPMALEIADRRVEAKPTAPALRVSRAEIREAAGDLPGAVADLRQAVMVQTRAGMPEALKKLAQMQEKAGEPCAAWQTWNTLGATSRKLRGEAQLAASKLLYDSACADQPVKGEAKIRRSDHGSWWIFPLKLDGKEVNLGADTSAPVSVLSKATASSLGLVGDGRDWFVNGFGGTLAGPMVHVAVLEASTLSVHDVDFVIVESLPDDLPGMMGSDLLSRIGFSEVSGKNWLVEGI